MIFKNYIGKTTLKKRVLKDMGIEGIIVVEDLLGFW
jgi:hypothetical protein